jgi:hypothetical protein
MGRGGVELRADWFIDNRMNPELKAAPNPFRPRPSSGMQQVRVQVHGSVFGQFDYLFDTGRTNWSPIFDREAALIAPSDEREMLASLKLVPPEDGEWYRVRGFERGAASGSDPYRMALQDSSPESGSFILMSLRRRNKENRKKASR